MKASEALILGSTITKFAPFNIDNCAIGAMLNAIGIPATKDMPVDENGIRTDRRDVALMVWPWMLEYRPGNAYGYIYEITSRFDNRVCNSEETLMDLAQWIKSIEPLCGECNSFVCSCGGGSITRGTDVMETVPEVAVLGPQYL